MGDVRMTKAMVYGIMFGMFATGSLNTLGMSIYFLNESGF